MTRRGANCWRVGIDDKLDKSNEKGVVVIYLRRVCSSSQGAGPRHGDSTRSDLMVISLSPRAVGSIPLINYKYSLCSSHASFPIATPSPALTGITLVPSSVWIRTRNSSVTGSTKCHSPHIPSPNGCGNSASSPSSSSLSRRNGWYNACRGVIRLIDSGCKRRSSRSSACSTSLSCS
jgi:hypothetical protein